MNQVADPLEGAEGLPSPALLDRNAIRKQARQAGVDLGKVPDDRIDGLLLTCRGDVDIAISAAILDPRPAWVVLHIGKRIAATPTNMTR